MSVPRDLELTPLQQAILRILWDAEEATVLEVQSALRAETRDLAQTTVATLLKRLEERSLVDHRKEGRQFVYFAVVDEDEVGRDLVGSLNEELYGGRASELFAHLLDTTELTKADFARIKKLVRDAERRRRG